jgi:hypothetical protein
MPRLTCSELLDRGDLAVCEGDTTTLARVARLLASRVGDPIAERCDALARECSQHTPARAWKQLRDEIVERVATAGT